MTPIVVVVGRPSVGKSTLFNRLLGAPQAIVDPQPGVTRDRHYGDAFLHGRKVTLIDTGGLDPESEDAIARGIYSHIQAAIEEADVVLCILEAGATVNEPDSRVIRILRRVDKPVVYAVNKVDGQRQAQESFEMFGLGIPNMLFISALHGRGIGELEAAITAVLPADDGRDEQEPEKSVPRVAIFGRPNAGKSSLCNRLTGEERSLVNSAPGTTRDPVNAHCEYRGREFLLVDTAGIRRRSHIDKQSVEAASVVRAIRAMENSDVAIVLCDAKEGVSEQDARLLGLCVDRGRAVILGLNKWDLIDRSARKDVLRASSAAVHFAPWVPVVPISALSGLGLDELVQKALVATEQFHRRVGTAEVNRFMEQVIAKHAPPTQGGRAPRIYYMTQVSTSPPHFVGISNAPEYITAAYSRYVANQIRKAFGFEGVPVIVKFRPKDRKSK